MTDRATSVRASHEERHRHGRKTKRALNVPLLVGTLIAVAVAAPAAYAWRAYQKVRIASAFLDRADQLEAEEEWEKAAGYLHLYVRMHADDVDPEGETAKVRARLAETFDRSGKDPLRAIKLYYEALGAATAAGRPSLRVKLTELLLKTRRFASAEAQALRLLGVASEAELDELLDAVEKGSRERYPSALRLAALALFGQWQSGASAARPDRAQTVGRLLESALTASPGDVELSAKLAQFHREGGYPTEGDRPLDSAARAELADGVMDRMIAAHPEDPEAYLVRYRYRTKYRIAEAGEDLQAALKWGPDHVGALLAAGQEALQRPGDAATRKSSLEAARQYYQKVIDIAPATEMAYLGLGDALLAAEDLGLATDTWQQGLLRCDKESVDLNLRLADALTAQGRLDEAQESLAVLDRAVARLATTASRAQRIAVERPTALCRAKWLVRKGKPAEAIPLLGQVTAGQMSSSTEVAQGCQAWLLLGEVYGGLYQWDRAAVAYEQAAKLQPASAQTRLAAAAAWTAAGRPEMAAANFDRALSIADSAETWFLLARARLQEQARLPEGERNWDLFARAIKEAKSPNRTPGIENPWRLDLLELDTLSARSKGKDEDAARKRDELKTRLREIEREYPDSSGLLQGLVLMYQRLGFPEEADRACDRFETLADQPVTVCTLRSRLHVLRKEYGEAQEALRAGLKTVPPQWHRPLEYELARISLEQGNLEEAHRQLVGLFKGNSTSLELALQLTELAFERGNLKDVQVWEEKLRQIEGPTGPYWRYCKARRLLVEAKNVGDPRFVEAAQLQAHLVGQRPAWPAAHLLGGLISQRQGDFQRAIEAYEEAIRLGEQRVSVYEQLISLLYRTQRFVEAEQYLARLQNQVPLSQNLSFLELSVAAKQGQLDRAVQSARRGAERRPNDLMAQIWLGQLLLANGQAEEAESTLQEAVRQAPTDLRAYNGLFTFYLRSEQPEQAEQVLQALAEKAALTEAQKAFALAQGYELLGKRDEALKSYREAERLAPESGPVLRRLAGFLLRYDLIEAEKTLRRLLRLQPDLGATRRTLAAILAQRGGEQEWEEAQRLLEQSGAAQDVSALDRRLQALLLARRGGKENLMEARRLLERLVADPKNTTPGDRLLLARLYEAEGKLQAARQEYLALVGRSDPAVSHLALYVDLLLRQESAEEADRWLKKLEQIAPNNLGTVSLRARWLHAEGKTPQIEPLVESLAVKIEKQLDEKGESKVPLYLGVGNVYSVVELYQAAERWYRRLVELEPTKYEPLAITLAQQDRTSEAIELCREAAKADTSTRPAAVLATVLVSGKAEKEDFQEAEAVFASALEEHPSDAELLGRLANVRIVQDQVDEAVELYRQVLGLKPKDVLALNNLATLLAEKEGSRQDALRYVDQAIGIAGPQAPLLDTKGMIYVHEGKAPEAVSLLQEAASTPGADPRFFFHLAVSYYRLGQVDEARQAFGKAVDGGLREQILTESDQAFLQELEKSLPQ